MSVNNFKALISAIVIMTSLMLLCLTARGDDVAPDIAGMITEGKNRMAQDPQGALKLFEQVLAKQPDNPEVLYYAATLNLQLNHPEQGLKYLQRSTELVPNNTRLLMLLGQAQEQFATADDAIKTYQKVIAKAPNSPEAAAAAKQIQLLQGKPATAPNAPTGDVASQIAAGKALMAKDPKGALQVFEQVLAQKPDNAEALYYAGNLYLELKQPEKGLQYMQRSADLAPEKPRLTLLLGQAQAHYGSADDAIKTFQKVIAKAPNSPEAAEATKQIQLLQNKPAVEAPSAPVGDVASQIAAGKALIASDPAAALQAFENILAQDPDNSEVLYYAGNLNLQLNHPEQGLKYLQHAVELSPGNNRLLLVLALAQQRFGHVEEAKTSFQKIIASDPNSAEAAEATRRLQSPESTQAVAPAFQSPAGGVSADVANMIAEGKNRMAHDPQGALQIFEQVLTQQPDNAEVLYYAGNLNLQLNHPEQGLKYLQHSADLNPGNTRLGLLLGQAQENFATADDAIKTYQKVIAIDPNSAEASEAQRRIAIIPGKKALAQGDFAKASQLFQQALAGLSDPTPMLSDIIAAYPLKHLDQLELFIETVSASMPDNRLAFATLANLYDRSNNYPKAIETYEHLLQIIPPAEATTTGKDVSQRLNTLKGLVAMQNNKFDEARIAFESFLAVQPDDETTQLNLATAYRGLGNKTKAEEILLKVIKQNPTDLIAQLKLGVLYVEMERPEDAARQFEKTRLQGRSSAEGAQADKFLADIYATKDGDKIKDKVEDEIIQGLRDQSAQHPDDYETWSKLSFMYLVRKNLNNAREAYANMSRIRPNDIGTKIIGASLSHRLGENDQAEKILQDVIQAHPDNADAHIELGTIYNDLGRTADAAKELETAKIVGIGSSQANNAVQMLTQIYGGPGGKELREQVKNELIKPLKEQVAKEPDNSEAWTKLANTYLSFDMLPEGREAYENSVRINPDDARAQGFLAELYDRSGDYGKAETALNKILDLTPNPAAQKSPLEKLTLVQGKKALNANDLVTAEAKFKQSIEQNPQNFLPHIYLASIYSSQSKFDDAIKEYNEVIKLVPSHSVAHLNLAGMYAQVKRDEDALTEYQTALRYGLPDDLKKVAEQQISSLEQRINGFAYSFNYTSGYQSNFNLTKDNPVEEFTHILGGSINYRYKLNEKPIYLGLSTNASYIIYQIIQFDFLSLGASPYTTFSWKGLDFTASLNYSTFEDFAHDTPSNKSNGFDFNVSNTFRMHSLLPFLGNSQFKKAAPSVWQLSFSSSEFTAFSSTINNARNSTIAGTLNQSVGNGWSWTGVYNYIVNKNTSLLGNDFAYTSNGITLQLSKVIKNGLSINGGYDLASRKYTNNDSATLFTAKRLNVNQRYYGGINYFLNDKLRLFANVSYTINESNLPTGFVFDPTNIGTAVAFQSTSLGDYTALSITTGISLSL